MIESLQQQREEEEEEQEQPRLKAISVSAAAPASAAATAGSSGREEGGAHLAKRIAELERENREANAALEDLEAKLTNGAAYVDR